MATSTQYCKVPDISTKTAFSLLYRFGLLLLCLLPLSIQAQSRLQTARDFLQSKGALKSLVITDKEDANDALILKYESTQAVTTPVAVYEHPQQGYVFIAGSDDRHRVVGHVDQGSFSYQKAPEALIELMRWYEDQPLAAEPTPDLLKSGSTLTPVAPLLDRYNLSLNQFLHPEVGGCSSGCVATAFTQIMAYHRYPAQGIGAHCYTHPNLGELCADFESSHYDWATMTEADYEALSLQVGIAMEMQYCLASGMTGSAPGRPGYEWAMETHFGYHLHPGSSQSWYLQNELEQERPIYITIGGENKGHAVVVDGIDNEGLFHINFGWGGAYNGYYHLNTSDLMTLGERVYGTNVAQAMYLSPKPFTVNESDSLALVAIHEAFGGSLDWDLHLPVIKWPGVLVMNGRVVGLQIARHNAPFEGYLPAELGQLSELRALYVTGKLHGTLPDELYDLQQLRDLTVDATYGSTLKGQLSDKLVQLQKLESISIFGLAGGDFA